MSATIAGVWEVAINDRPYKAIQDLHTRRFLDVIRQQADSGEEPSERSLNPNDLWRRSQDDWVFGTGQSIYDDDESTRKRYRTSTGINPWEKGELTLLKTAARIDTLTGSIGKSVIAQDKLWVINGTTVAIWDGTLWSASAAVPLGQTIRDIATDGMNVYLAVRNDGKSAGGVYVISKGSTTPVLLNSVIPDLVAYVRGRLMVAASYSLYNIMDTTTTTPPAPITAAAINSDWTWDAFGAGQSYIYVAGHSGDLALVYRISLREDGTALTAPVVAAQMPDGERVTCIQSYLTVVALGTTRGVRVAVPQSGSLQYGAVVPTAGAVRALEPQDRFVWAGSDGGLFRVDLTRFIPNIDLTPAGAPDLTSGVAGVVASVHTWGGRRLWVVENVGVYLESAATYVASGTFESGQITYALPDTKQFRFLDVAAQLSGSDTVVAEVAYDGGPWVAAGTLTAAAPKATFTLTGSGDRCEIRLTLTSATGTTTPKVTRFTLRAFPVPSRTEQVNVALDLRATLLGLNGSTHFRDVWNEFELLQDLVRTGETVTYQEFDKTYTASVENVQWGPELDVDVKNTSWEGTCVVTLKLFS